jgi:Tfp pilus assembly protein PilN
MIQRVNLIPEEFKVKKTRTRFPAKYLIVIILGLLYITPLNMSINAKIKDIDSKKSALEKEKLELVTNNMKFTSLRQETEKTIKEISLINKISVELKDVIKDRVFWSDVLKEVSFLVPKKLWLDNISSRDVTVDIDEKEGVKDASKIVMKTVKEVVITGSSYNNETITSFIRSLEGSYFLDEITLKYVKKRIINKDFTVYDFEVVSRLRERIGAPD